MQVQKAKGKRYFIYDIIQRTLKDFNCIVEIRFH